MFLNNRKKLRNMQSMLRLLTQSTLREQFDRLQREALSENSSSLIPYGYKVFSQHDEDGIIREIFNRIGVTNKTFVEFGIGNGLENNSHALLFADWRGLWIEASRRSVNTIRKQFSEIIRTGQLTVVEAFITRDNINSLIVDNFDATEIDMLSIDIDGNDYHVLEAINCINPRLIVLEYNAKFAPPIEYCMDYDESGSWDHDDCFGASIKFLENRLHGRGYSLVACGMTGLNCFFVQSELVEGKFTPPYTSEHLYQPARYYLRRLESGHPSAYSTLVKSRQTNSGL
ncbi:MAG: hypothetical protein QGD92_10410 [Gammaproteobacteria bacterium]|nr:hypothetical protein [Gammaproteobacteria bacterium]